MLILGSEDDETWESVLPGLLAGLLLLRGLGSAVLNLLAHDEELRCSRGLEGAFREVFGLVFGGAS